MQQRRWWWWWGGRGLTRQASVDEGGEDQLEWQKQRELKKREEVCVCMCKEMASIKREVKRNCNRKSRSFEGVSI